MEDKAITISDILPADLDLAEFVRELVEEWDIDQLREYAMDNMYEFYRTHKQSLQNDYALFLEDQEAHHVQGY